MFRITFTTVVTTKSSRGTDLEMAQHFVLSTLNAPTAAQRLNPSAEIVGDGNDTPAAAAPYFQVKFFFNLTLASANTSCCFGSMRSGS